MYIINMIKELLCVKRQQFELSASYFNRHDIDCMIDILCTAQCHFFFFFIMCTHIQCHYNNNNIAKHNT